MQSRRGEGETHEDHRHVDGIDAAASLRVDLEDAVLVADRVRLVRDVDDCGREEGQHRLANSSGSLALTYAADDDGCEIELRRAECNGLRAKLEAEGEQRGVPTRETVRELAGPRRPDDAEDTAETEEADLERVVVERRRVEKEGQASPC